LVFLSIDSENPKCLSGDAAVQRCTDRRLKRMKSTDELVWLEVRCRCIAVKEGHCSVYEVDRVLFITRSVVIGATEIAEACPPPPVLIADCQKLVRSLSCEKLKRWSYRAGESIPMMFSCSGTIPECFRQRTESWALLLNKYIALKILRVFVKN